MIGKLVYFQPLGDKAHRAIAAAFADLSDGMPATRETLTVMARSLEVPRAAGNVAWFTFDELCARPLVRGRLPGARRAFRGDHRRGHPAARPAPAQRGTALPHFDRRALRSPHAARRLGRVPPQEIYTEGDGSFEFQRTVSRLMEMQSEDYIANRGPG